MAEKKVPKGKEGNEARLKAAYLFYLKSLKGDKALDEKSLQAAQGLVNDENVSYKQMKAMIGK